ncbi:hypothetical protein HNQ77_004273 [Silvibacterium bohemicum]|uniref:Heme oxygenase n=1 Tax=Silvibacterium bohemicum TaxID=1577686 RepID=A0A841K588_9BACT|nr:DUF3050 domain-containing protein [Silvibacterium bohemicum]MBB6146301.1 hypothetical protein [Silvibacterium bohemicum]
MLPVLSPAQALESRLAPLRDRLARHPLYASIRSMDHLRIFMESHVFAVWDFMSLLKALQNELTCVRVPWVPNESSASRRFINAIVLDEESDEYEGRTVSHFELYIEAMRECGADTGPVLQLLNKLSEGSELSDALNGVEAPVTAKDFVASTFVVIAEGRAHAIAAAFTFGREDLIPEMFRGLVREMNGQLSGRLQKFIWYLERHIELDGEDHGPLALRMIEDLCGDDAKRWSEATEAAEAALAARLKLWDGILAEIAERGVKPA